MPKKPSKKSKATGLTVLVVLDRSGSMQICKNDTIGAYNAYVEELEKASPEAQLALMQFDTQGIDTTPFRKIGEVERLNDRTFQPRGGTPLLDAIGKGVSQLDAATGDRKALVILTDGEENASREYTKAAVKALLDERQEKQGWLVIYLGANQDAIQEGAKYGTGFANTMTFDTQNVSDTMGATARATVAYAMAPSAGEGRLRAAFTSAERAKAKPGAGKQRRVASLDTINNP